MKDTWIAYYAPADDINHSKRGFKTEEEAWDYIKSHLCQTCKDDLDRGYIEYEYDGLIDKSEVNHVGDTSCGAEWYVLKEKDYDKAEDFGDILDACGYKVVYRKDKENLNE